MALTTWVLGAGFSRALGGPLINHLLAPKRLSVITNLHPVTAEEPKLSRPMFSARCFFKHGLDEGRWAHAEEFIDNVETAVLQHQKDRSAGHPPHSHTLLSEMLKGVVKGEVDGGKLNCDFESLAALATAARQALAADCCTFLRDADPATERWRPYKEWAQALDGSHTVVTFNYDCVPEILQEDGGKLKVVCAPGAAIEGEEEQVRSKGFAPVLKVHGSTNWRLVDANNGKVIKPWDWREEKAVHEPSDQELVMGVPGPRKRKLIQSEHLQHIWEHGMRAIRSADTVYFVGYRFPPTDSDSRTDVLAALKENKQPTLKVYTVLGPVSEDTPRLTQLLKMAVRPSMSRDVIILPLYAEDFLGIAKRMGFLVPAGSDKSRG